jgi:hypothetical protein
MPPKTLTPTAVKIDRIFIYGGDGPESRIDVSGIICYKNPDNTETNQCMTITVSISGETPTNKELIKKINRLAEAKLKAHIGLD